MTFFSFGFCKKLRREEKLSPLPAAAPRQSFGGHLAAAHGTADAVSPVMHAFGGEASRTARVARICGGFGS